MLNLTGEAVQQLMARAAETPANGFRFGGFAKHYQDYEPSLDHFAFMRTGLNYMLMCVTSHWQIGTRHKFTFTTARLPTRSTTITMQHNAHSVHDHYCALHRDAHTRTNYLP